MNSLNFTFCIKQLINKVSYSFTHQTFIQTKLFCTIKVTPTPSTSSVKKISCKTDININGKIYRELGKHIIYCLSKVSRSSVDSLVDRGANGGVAGNDVRIIAKHPHRNVEVRGIENHEISSILLVTASCVTLITSGEVITIVHQCACHGKNKTIHSSPKLITAKIK